MVAAQEIGDDDPHVCERYRVTSRMDKPGVYLPSGLTTDGEPVYRRLSDDAKHYWYLYRDLDRQWRVRLVPPPERNIIVIQNTSGEERIRRGADVVCEDRELTGRKRIEPGERPDLDPDAAVSVMFIYTEAARKYYEQ